MLTTKQLLNLNTNLLNSSIFSLKILNQKSYWFLKFLIQFLWYIFNFFFEITTYTLASWNKDTNLLKTFFLFYNREIFVLLVNTFASCNTRAKLFDISRSLCVSNFLSNNNANLFWDTRVKLINIFCLLCVSKFLSNNNVNLFCNVNSNLVFNDEISL